MNKGAISDTEMNNILDGIVDSLFSLFATLGMLCILFKHNCCYLIECCSIIIHLIIPYRHCSCY